MMDFSLFLRENLPSVNSFHPHFNEAIAHILNAGGKHFRAKLYLGVVEIYAPDLLDRAQIIALAIELMHSYSLIHDDLPAFDNAALRRGVATLHEKYDEVTAVLVADAFNTHSFLLISRSEFEAELKVRLIECLAQNAGLSGMVIGQALDCFFENKTLDLEQLSFIHTHKTAKLIAACMKMGAITAKLSQSEALKLYDIGILLGLIFQIHDDILDASKDSKELGKPAQNDACKNSYVNLMGLEQAREHKKLKQDELTALLEAQNPQLKALLLKLSEKYLKD